MPSPKYYRRQSELCLQLALLYSDPQMTLLLVNLATELRAKADEATARRGHADLPDGIGRSSDGGHGSALLAELGLIAPGAAIICAGWLALCRPR